MNDEIEAARREYHEAVGEYSNRRDLYRRDMARIRSGCRPDMRAGSDAASYEADYRGELSTLERRAHFLRARWLKLSGTKEEFPRAKKARQLTLPLSIE